MTDEQALTPLDLVRRLLATPDYRAAVAVIQRIAARDALSAPDQPLLSTLTTLAVYLDAIDQLLREPEQ